MQRDDALLEAIDAPALIVEQGRIGAANRAALDLFGRNSIGRDLRLVIRHPVALQTIAAGVDAEIELTGIGSSERPWVVRVRNLSPRSTLVSLVDRTALASAERMRTDFVANASHELRTPLATIIGYAETLAEDGELADELRSRFGSTIEVEARRMLRIVEDLMSLSRIEADRYRTPSQAVDMEEVLRLALDHSSESIKQADCRIETDVAPGLRPVSGDPGQLVQLAVNLIGNAIRYGCSDRSNVIEVSLRPERGRVTLEVRDHGEGIAPEHLPRLTERFYRIDPARSRESGGTGLGLAIVKHIVERHRGSLDVQSSPGAGTTVRVSLPSH